MAPSKAQAAKATAKKAAKSSSSSSKVGLRLVCLFLFACEFHADAFGCAIISSTSLLTAQSKKSAAEEAPERKSTRTKKTTLSTDKGDARKEDIKEPPSDINVHAERQPIPTKNKDGQLV
jgi:hypothetical protein